MTVAVVSLRRGQLALVVALFFGSLPVLCLLWTSCKGTQGGAFGREEPSRI